uniref:Uncharacterized protein n=1 Tax=Osmundaria fimbriata TaxID=228265 RepID=A0A1Z1M4M3_OSMFI|nr:hypothetical protein [Osmundaria fimbriata]ARW60793.1 hypothetical protein [Osmundaria fimbriata]
MCICINCRHMYNCHTYQFIAVQHGHHYHYKKKIIINTFTPIYTIIKINIIRKSNKISLDWDLIECLSFIETPGNWLVRIET